MENNCELVPRETLLSFPNCLSAEGRRKMLEIFTRLYQQVCAITKTRMWEFFFPFFFFCTFRLDTMVKTWGTVLSAKGSSWFCGWKEWSSQWLQSTWGSKPPSLKQKCFLTIWAQDFTQNSIKRQSERENGWFTSLIQTMSHLSKGVLVAQVMKKKCTKSSVWLSHKHLL